MRRMTLAAMCAAGLVSTIGMSGSGTSVSSARPAHAAAPAAPRG
jgi:hypothetical protein